MKTIGNKCFGKSDFDGGIYWWLFPCEEEAEKFAESLVVRRGRVGTYFSRPPSVIKGKFRTLVTQWWGYDC